MVCWGEGGGVEVGPRRPGFHLLLFAPRFGEGPAFPPEFNY